MDEDEKNVSCAPCQSRWLGKISLIAVVGIFSASISPLSASLDTKLSSAPPPTKQAEYPLMKPMDAVSIQSRNQYNQQKCSYELKRISTSMEGKDAQDKAKILMEFIAGFTVCNADLQYGQVLQAKMVKIPTAKEICSGLLCITLEQVLPLAKKLSCWEQLSQQLENKYSPIFNMLQTKLKTITHLSKNRPVDSSGIQTAFAYEWAQKMEKVISKIIKQYQDLFIIKNCPEEIMDRLNEYAEEFKEITNNLRKSLSTSQGAAALNRIEDELTRFIVTKADIIAIAFPNEKLDKIYGALAIITLQYTLPLIARLGTLWGFANALKNGGISSLKEIFKIKFQLYGKFISNQCSPTIKEEPEGDQSKLTETEKRDIERRKQKEKDRRDASMETYIVAQTNIIIEFLYRITQKYLDVFQKRDTANWPI
ncbi:MAG: hypothetical protein LBR92_00090 [Puniceicoccales bacterium]|jgi:hypothetical protein|nr:hypothetical protein [Puniceicoccales bacterium]